MTHADVEEMVHKSHESMRGYAADAMLSEHSLQGLQYAKTQLEEAIQACDTALEAERMRREEESLQAIDGLIEVINADTQTIREMAS